MIHLRHFKAAAPTCRDPDLWVTLLNKHLPSYEINTLGRQALFLAQTAHESSDFRVTVENLNYSADGLQKTFGKYYKTRALAVAEARKPHLIANRVYGGRMGNHKPNDGYNFRGLGIIQLTGRDNFTRFGASIGLNAEQARAFCETKEGMVRAACWFWTVNNLNRFAASLDIQGSTRVINGGLHGLADRKARFERILIAD